MPRLELRREPAQATRAPAYAVYGELTADGARIVLIAAGADHHVAAAARQAELLTPLVRPTQPAGGLTLPVSWAAVVQLANTYGKAWRPAPRLAAWVAAEFARRTAVTDTPLSVPLPAGLVPRPYQVAGANMIAATGSVLLTDEAGTGKTITTLLGLLERELRGVRTTPVVVVCPSSVVDPWVEAWRTWAPGRRAVAWRGTPKRRRALAGTADIYVTSWDTARMDASTTNPAKAPLLALGPQAVVLDEVHLAKNPTSARSHAARRLTRNAGTAVALSGTPITHHPGDLWPALVALYPNAWPSRERWAARYCQTISGDYSSTILGLEPMREPEFRTTLLGAHRRVAKADVLTQLPPKVYSVRTVELPEEWRRAYDAMEGQMLAELPDGGELPVMGVLAQLTRLQQLSCAAADVETTTKVDDEGFETAHHTVTLRAPSWKVDALLEVLDERPSKPVVTFAPSAQLIRLAGAQAVKAGHRVGYIIGGQSQRERTATVARFQAGELDLLCVTTGAGGVGLTLTAAGTVVFLQRPWSLVEALQSEDRCHRLGSEIHDSIEIIDVVASKTIDSRVRAVLRDKAGQLADLVQDPRVVAELLGGASVRDLRRKKAS